MKMQVFRKFGIYLTEYTVSHSTRPSLWHSFPRELSLHGHAVFRAYCYLKVPVPVAARSKAWVCGRLPAEIVGSNPTGGAWMFVCCECCVLSGRGLCVKLITRPEESYRLWCVVMCDLETSRKRRSWPTLGGGAVVPKTEQIALKY